MCVARTQLGELRASLVRVRLGHSRSADAVSATSYHHHFAWGVAGGGAVESPESISRYHDEVVVTSNH